MRLLWEIARWLSSNGYAGSPLRSYQLWSSIRATPSEMGKSRQEKTN